MSQVSSRDGDERIGISEEDGTSTSHKIFVGGLSWETDEESLRGYFSEFGTVSDCVIMRDRHTRLPRGFGFVSYEDVFVANKVASQKHVLDGRQVEAKHAVPRSDYLAGSNSAHSSGNRSVPKKQRSQEALPAQADEVHKTAGSGGNNSNTSTRKIFVGGLPSQCRSEELREHFSSYGKVVDAQVLIDHKTGNSRGFGFVTFAEESAVEAVMGDSQASCRQEVMGKMAEVKRAEPKQVLDAKKSRDVVHGNVYAKVNPNMGYNNGMGIMQITPLLTAQYANYYGTWAPFPLAQPPPGPVTYYTQGTSGLEFNPYVFDTLYGPSAQGLAHNAGGPGYMVDFSQHGHRRMNARDDHRFDPYVVASVHK